MNFLFIAWDGPQVTYMEGLFFPIFREISKKKDIHFHIIHFTWGRENQIAQTKSKAIEFGFYYSHVRVWRQPHPALGALCTIIRGIYFIGKYIKRHRIEVIMPRSTMPAIMVNNLSTKLKKEKTIIFDADGLPLEERVDFGGLSKSSIQYKIQKRQECKMIRDANRVVTRSKKAIEIHQNNIEFVDGDKFFVVKNGRSMDHFKPDQKQRKKVRGMLSVAEDATLFVYCGSLGPQYGLKEMVKIFQQVAEKEAGSKFLIMTGFPEYLKGKLSDRLRKNIIVKKVSFNKVPSYLNAGDIAFAIRQPTFSMQGIAPIKLGEYLLTGIPTIASKGIGDTEEIIRKAPYCYLFDHDVPAGISKAVNWVENLGSVNRDEIREFGIHHFSLKESNESYIQAFEN